jgi:hypothetical protein
MARQSISDEFYQGLGNAVDDIRAKFEESVWGRAVTERGGDVPEWPQAQPEPALGSVTRNIEVGRDQTPEWPQAQQQDHEQQRDNRDVDLDR